MTESELLFTQALDCNRAELYLDRNRELTLNQSLFISSALKRRASGEPMQYILGEECFMGMEFKVNRHVLIPRAETEILVETVLRLAPCLSPLGNGILELGTGSGCIAVSIAKNIPGSQITAIDISFKALEVAKDNAELNQIQRKQIKFIQSDLFSSLSNQKFDLIISNPPYISIQELSVKAAELSFEPTLALEAGFDGLDFYRRIITQADNHLDLDGFLAFEIGLHQACGVRDLLLAQEKFDFIRTIKDYNNIQRVIIAKKRI